MAKLVMDRKAADNKYLHRDFHVSMDIGIEYIGNQYGDQGVKDYLTTFATAFYSPLVADIKAKGLAPLCDYITNIYEIEEAPEVLKTKLTDKELIVSVSSCPAVTFMKKDGHTPCKWYIEATRTVNQAIADNAGIGFEWISYSEENGKADYRFFIK